MQQKERPQRPEPQPYPRQLPMRDDPVEELYAVCSATECTGLMPAMPQSSEEAEQYETIYPYLPDPVPKDSIQKQ